LHCSNSLKRCATEQDRPAGLSTCACRRRRARKGMHLRLVVERIEDARLTARTPTDVVGLPQRSVARILALARIG
jgi:hypothetical protein